MNYLNIKFTTSQTVLLGITFAMVFIFLMFIGIGVPVETLMIVGGLFAVAVFLAGNTLSAEKNRD